MIVVRFFKDLFTYIKYYRILKKVYIDEKFVENLSKQFRRPFKIDWIGRVYTVINPFVKDNIDEAAGSSSEIYSFDKDGSLNNDMFVEQYIMNKLNIANMFLKANNLFDMLTYDIRKINEENYLFIIKPLPYDDLKKSTKRFILFISILIVLLIGFLIFFI